MVHFSKSLARWLWELAGDPLERKQAIEWLEARERGHIVVAPVVVIISGFRARSRLEVGVWPGTL